MQTNTISLLDEGGAYLGEMSEEDARSLVSKKQASVFRSRAHGRSITFRDAIETAERVIGRSIVAECNRTVRKVRFNAPSGAGYSYWEHIPHDSQEYRLVADTRAGSCGGYSVQ